MKTGNFPEKKNQRRKVALENLQHRNQAGQGDEKKNLAEISSLEAKVVDSRREQRTKKRRGG